MGWDTHVIGAGYDGDDYWARDVGPDGGAAPAQEAAVHVVADTRDDERVAAQSRSEPTRPGCCPRTVPFERGRRTADWVIGLALRPEGYGVHCHRSAVWGVMDGLMGQRTAAEAARQAVSTLPTKKGSHRVSTLNTEDGEHADHFARIPRTALSFARKAATRAVRDDRLSRTGGRAHAPCTDRRLGTDRGHGVRHTAHLGLARPECASDAVPDGRPALRDQVV
ncbi:DUF5709 domain-containing protein [Streptomyces sp. NPDC055722]